MLREEFLTPMQIDEQELAESIHVPPERIKEIISERKSINPSIALRLAKYFGMSADFWMNLQLRWICITRNKPNRKTLTPFVRT